MSIDACSQLDKTEIKLNENKITSESTMTSDASSRDDYYDETNYGTVQDSQEEEEESLGRLMESEQDKINSVSGDKQRNKGSGLRKCRIEAGSSNKYNRHWRKKVIADSYDAEEDQLVCKYCDKRLKDPGNFVRHIRCHENPELFNKCPFCDYKTVGRHTLREHLASRHQVDPDGNRLERNIKCDQCSFTCVSNFQLRNHLYLRHAEKGLKCDICGYSSHSKSVIAIHVKAVHGNNERPFQCDRCGYCAKTRGVFRNHLKVHSGRRVCDVCGLALTQHSFSGHMKLHSSDVRPHTCHLCAFAARKRYCLKVHLKNVHKIDISYLDLGKNDVQESFLGNTDSESLSTSSLNMTEHGYHNVSHNLQQMV